MTRTGLLLALALVVSLLGAARAQALGLGDITLDSALNQPLDATIELLDVAGLDAGQIQIALGTAAEFGQAGLERTPLVERIRFDVTVTGATGSIRLTTVENIPEPFLVFVLSATWPNGRLLRDYTLLLDLPTFSNAPVVQPQPALSNAPVVQPQPALSNAPVSVQPQPTPAPPPATPDPQPVVSTPPPAPAAEPVVSTPAPASSATEQAVAVVAGDTLWEIALNTRPDASVSVQQMMVAIQRANEDAFIGNNINQLRSGRVLRIPSLQEINVIEQDAAIARVNQQNSVLGGQPLAVNSTETAGAAPVQQDQLTVLSGDQNAGGAGSSDLAATIAALENELMLSEESLDRARLENLELTNRLAALEEEIDLLRNIIAIEDQRIAQLQAELARQNAATAQTQLQNASQPAPAADGLGGMLQNSSILLGALLVLVLAAVAVLVVRRRRAEAEFDAQAYNPALAAVAPQQDFADERAPGFLEGLLARFRRPKEEEENYEEEQFDAMDAAVDDDDDADMFRAAPTGNAGARTGSADAVAPHGTEELLTEMGIDDDLDAFGDILDDIDEADADTAAAESADEETAAQEVVVQAVTETAVTGPVERSVEFAPQLAAEKQEAAPAAAAPEAFEFNLNETPAEQPATAATAAEVEAFEFTPQATVTAASASVAPEPEPEVEMYSFNTGPAADARDEIELEDLTFDDTTLSIEDAPESEEIQYKSRHGQDEFDTKLDLATAFEAMGDVADALEILDEVIAEGNPAQVETAKRLQQSWRSS